MTEKIKPAELIVNVTHPGGTRIYIHSEINHRDLSIIIKHALYHYVRELGWIKAELDGNPYYACRVVPLPFIYSYAFSAETPLSDAFYQRVIKTVELSAGSVEPEVWIAVNADWLYPFPPAVVNAAEARRLQRKNEQGFLIELAELPVVDEIKSSADDAAAGKKKKSAGAIRKEKILQRFYQGWSVNDIAADQSCSPSSVYKTVFSKTGVSAMEYRYKRWQMISNLYFATPRRSMKEISEICDVSHSQIYHAVKKVAEKENQELPKEKRDRKLSKKDVGEIKLKISQGMLRKEILEQYDITATTLIKYIGKDPSQKVIPKAFKEKVIRLRMMGKTLEETADKLEVSTQYVKKAWKEVKEDPEVKRRRLKYDNRNPLSKRDRDQAVNAVLIGGHTRKQIYTQYGINALTLRRYIRKALEKETDEIREKAEKADNDKKNKSQ